MSKTDPPPSYEECQIPYNTQDRIYPFTAALGQTPVNPTGMFTVTPQSNPGLSDFGGSVVIHSFDHSRVYVCVSIINEQSNSKRRHRYTHLTPEFISYREPVRLFVIQNPPVYWLSLCSEWLEVETWSPHMWKHQYGEEHFILLHTSQTVFHIPVMLKMLPRCLS
ncbi:hypothetical protein Baya_14319 [Bagarius yarrelli]|uniref:Uncharacterized protein n=1 Tax=Bagarius yarrelli TaxID=175774 RepID=A0A556V8V5_BAGYA|nr:hypothetical protein Baya_14319 [Bagarius yarrelli]